MDHPQKILLVEDNPQNADMLTRRLERYGYVVTLAVDGGQTLAAIEAERADLILLDIRLPDMSGIELAGKIRETANGCDVPMIAVTADALPEVREGATLAGCTGFVTKPVDFRELLEEISRQLGADSDSR